MTDFDMEHVEQAEELQVSDERRGADRWTRRMNAATTCVGHHVGAHPPRPAIGRRGLTAAGRPCRPATLVAYPAAAPDTSMFYVLYVVARS